MYEKRKQKIHLHLTQVKGKAESIKVFINHMNNATTHTKSAP